MDAISSRSGCRGKAIAIPCSLVNTADAWALAARNNLRIFWHGWRARFWCAADSELDFSWGFDSGQAGARGGVVRFALAVLLWLRFAEGLPLSSIGLPSPDRERVRVRGSAGIDGDGGDGGSICRRDTFVPLESAAALAERQAILNTPLWYRFLLVVRAAVVEEILFRGYLIEKVRQISGSMALAFVVSVAAFTFGHLRAWGAVHLIAVGASGPIFAAQYIWRRDLASNMLGHFLTDAVGFLI